MLHFSVTVVQHVSVTVLQHFSVTVVEHLNVICYSGAALQYYSTSLALAKYYSRQIYVQWDMFSKEDETGVSE